MGGDQVVVIDEGRIVEHGRHSELLQREDGLYRRYAQRQFLFEPPVF